MDYPWLYGLSMALRFVDVRFWLIPGLADPFPAR
jgi:hypothetical protein